MPEHRLFAVPTLFKQALVINDTYAKLINFLSKYKASAKPYPRFFHFVSGGGD